MLGLDDLDGVVEVLRRLAVDRDDAVVAQIAPAEQVLFADLLGERLRFGHDRLGKPVRQVVRAQDDLDVDAGFAQEPQPLLDDTVRHPPVVGKRRQPRLDDLSIAGAAGLSVRDANHRVELRVVRKDDLLAVPRLEAADHALPRPVEDLDDGSRGLARVAAAPTDPRLLLARQDRVAVHGAVHSGTRDEKVVSGVHQDEPEPLGTHGDPAGHHVGVFDRGVLFAPNAGDLAAPLEVLQAVAEGILFRIRHAEGLDQLLERQNPRALLAQALEDLGITRQHGPESISRDRG